MLKFYIFSVNTDELDLISLPELDVENQDLQGACHMFRVLVDIKQLKIADQINSLCVRKMIVLQTLNLSFTVA